MKRIVTLILAVALTVVLAAGTLAEGNVLKVGMEGTYAPYTYHDDTGKLTGFEVDVANAIGEKIGYSVEFAEAAWDSLFPALDAGTIDVIMNQVTITDARLETYDFSTPYIYIHPVVIVAAENEDIKSFEDLAGKRAAEGLTSNYNALAKSYGAEIVGQDVFALALELVKSGQADAVVNDELTYAYWQVTTGDFDSRGQVRRHHQQRRGHPEGPRGAARRHQRRHRRAAGRRHHRLDFREVFQHRRFPEVIRKGGDRGLTA